MLKCTPFRASTSSASETRKELTMATTSHQAFTRHQNQRTRYRSPVPAPIWRMTSKASLALSRRYTVAEDSRNNRTVASLPTST